MIIAAIVAAVLVVVIGVFELVGRLVERNARDRFDSMSPDKRFKYQNEMRKKQL